MNLLQNLLNILNSNEYSNLFSSLTKSFNERPTPQQTDYYSLPNYQTNLNQQTQEISSLQQNNALNFETIVKIAGILLQFLSNRKQPKEEKPEIEVFPSKIDQYKKVE